MTELAVVAEPETAAAVAVAAAPNEPLACADAAADCTPAQQAELRYQAVVEPLVDHALASNNPLALCTLRPTAWLTN